MKRYHVLLLLLPLLWSCATTGPTPAERLLALYPPERPFPESRFASFGGIRLHYRTWTPDRATEGKALLLHTAGASTVSFEELGPQLAAEGWAVLAVDLPAFGFSDQALEFDHTLANRSNLVWSLLDRLDTEENAFPPADRWMLAGHGMGAQVATQMTLERPRRTRRLVLFASELLGSQSAGSFLWFPPVRWALGAWLADSLYTEEGVRELLSEAYGRPATDEEVARYAAPLVRPRMPAAYVHYAHTAGSFSFDLASIENPVLVIWGTEDVRTDPELAQPTADAFPNGELALVEGGGHLPMETHTAAVSDAIALWVEENQ
ncbi:MAG: alpha/beta fold hydrolase [Spirochaetota bacterium]